MGTLECPISPKAPPVTIERGPHEMRESVGRHVPALPNPVHVQLVPQFLVEGLAVGGEPGKTQKNVFLHSVDFVEVVGDHLELDAQSLVGSHSDAVVAHHCGHGAAIDFERVLRHFICLAGIQ